MIDFLQEFVSPQEPQRRFCQWLELRALGRMERGKTDLRLALIINFDGPDVHLYFLNVSAAGFVGVQLFPHSNTSRQPMIHGY